MDSGSCKESKTMSFLQKKKAFLTDLGKVLREYNAKILASKNGKVSIELPPGHTIEFDWCVMYKEVVQCNLNTPIDRADEIARYQLTKE